MKKPFLRVTKWLGDIPVEAGCTSCVEVTFRVRSTSHRPNREEYRQTLQREFDHHVKTVHLEAASEDAAGVATEAKDKA
jgi:hypothetical protein